MTQRLIDTKVDQIMRSPGGRILLVILDEHGIAPSEAVNLPTSLHLVSAALGHLNPWLSDRDERLPGILRRGEKLEDLAQQLLRQPGIEAWWSPLRLDGQVWIQPTATTEFPNPEHFPTPATSPGPMEQYAQRHYDRFSTSTEISGLTSQLAEMVSGATDWWIDDYAAQRKRLAVSSAARILEIGSAEDWHKFVIRHGVQCESGATPDPNGQHGRPWANNDGLVPDWHSAAREWDGVHVTLWAFLTAMQVRIESEAGWTEPWTWGGEETTWLHWAFDSVENMTSIQASPNVGDSGATWQQGVEAIPEFTRWDLKE